MIDDILEIAKSLKVRRDRIDVAANDIVVTTQEFDEYQHAVDELDAAIVDLKSAAQHVWDARTDTSFGDLERLLALERDEAELRG